MSEYNIQMNKYNALNVEYDQLYPATKIENVDGLDTALQNKAPAGYGLGTTNVNGESYDANNCTQNGWYVCTVNTPNSEWWYILTVSNYVNDLIVQKAWYYNGGKVLESMRLGWLGKAEDQGGGWQPWEYVNPPMQLGIEYRTTERYLGKPVYVKVIEAGFNPAGTIKETSDKTVSASGLVRFSAVRGGWSFPNLMYGGNYEDSGDIQVAVQASSDGIHVYTWSKTRDMTSATVNVSVYYTKD